MGFETHAGMQVWVGQVQVWVEFEAPMQNPYLCHGFQQVYSYYIITLLVFLCHHSLPLQLPPQHGLSDKVSHYILFFTNQFLCTGGMPAPPYSLVLGKFGFKPIQTWFELKLKPSLGFQFGDFC